MECCPTLHMVLLLDKVTKQGTADAVPHRGKGLARSLPDQIRSKLYLSTHLTPAHPITNIFVLTGDIGGWVRGRRSAGWCG